MAVTAVPQVHQHCSSWATLSASAAGPGVSTGWADAACPRTAGGVLSMPRSGRGAARRDSPSSGPNRQGRTLATAPSGDPGEFPQDLPVNPLRSCELGRFPDGISLMMLVEGLTKFKIRGRLGLGSHKGGYGTVRKSEGARGRQEGPAARKRGPGGPARGRRRPRTRAREHGQTQTS